MMVGTCVYAFQIVKQKNNKIKKKHTNPHLDGSDIRWHGKVAHVVGRNLFWKPVLNWDPLWSSG